MPDSSELPAYRWIVVLAVGLILALAMGSIVNGISAYIVPMQELHGWERGDISLINVSGIIGLAFGGLLMGPQADKRGARPVVLFGVTVLAICYLLASFATQLWQYYAIFFVAGFFGAGSIFSPAMAAVGNWFPVGAGLAIGIAAAGQALGQGGVPFASSHLIRNFGVSSALAVTGAAMLLLLLPLAFLLRPSPFREARDTGAALPDIDTYPPFRLVVPTLCLAILLCCTCMSVPLVHLVPLIQDRGFALEDAGSVIFFMLMVGVIGRVSFGKLADIIGPLPAYMSATAWMAVTIYGLTMMESLRGFYIYAAIYGFGYAGVMTGILVSVARLVHPSRRASGLAVVTLFGWFGHASGGFLGGFVYDQTGGYEFAYGLAAAAGLANLAVVGSLYLKLRGPGARMAHG